MDDLISRQAAIEALEKESQYEPRDGRGGRMNKPVVNANRICEQYTLIFKHEINDNGIPYKIEEPIIARCVLPLTEPYKEGEEE